MTLRGKLSLWLILLIILAALIYFTPAVTKHSWMNTIQDWLTQYQHAADKAEQDNDNQDDQKKSEDEVNPGAMMVVLDKQSDGYAGIETEPAKESHYRPQIKALARVVDLAPLVAFKSRYNQAQTALSVAKVTEQSALQEYNRVKKLVGGVARKNINYADATWREALASRQGAQQQCDDLKLEAQQRWGKVIGAWLLQDNATELNKLFTRQASLLLLTMPAGAALPPETDTIHVSLNNDLQHANPARLIGPAYETDQSTIQGETYYFEVATGQLRTGMRLDAWIPRQNKALQGVWVPDQAIIWYVGQAWTFVELKPGRYQRRSLKSGIVADNGIFMQQGIKPGDHIVTVGAQMLLSQEFKWQIQDGGDD